MTSFKFGLCVAALIYVLVEISGLYGHIHSFDWSSATSDDTLSLCLLVGFVIGLLWYMKRLVKK